MEYHKRKVLDGVIKERSELNSKREKLFAFFNSELFIELDQNEKDRLRTQYGAMGVYEEILSQRIAGLRVE